MQSASYEKTDNIGNTSELIILTFISDSLFIKKCEIKHYMETIYTRVYCIGHKEKHIERWKYLNVMQYFELESKNSAVGTFFVITATGIDPELTVRQLINNSKCGRFYALQFIFILFS